MELFKSFLIAASIVLVVLGLGALLVTYQIMMPIFCVVVFLGVLTGCIHSERGF